MCQRKRSAKVNVKLLVILLVVVAGVGGGLVAARQIRRGILSERALNAGHAAYEKQDWKGAVTNWRVYLARNPDDLDVLRKFGESLMARRPFDVTAAISAYRRILQLDPSDAKAGEELVGLYGMIENFEEMAAAARSRMERDPNDVKSPLWLANALIQSNKRAEARKVLEPYIQRLETLPAKHPEYVQACAQMAVLVAEEAARSREKAAAGTAAPQQQQQEEAPAGGESLQPTPLDWLNRAVAYEAGSGQAQIYRARFRRMQAGALDASEPNRPLFLALARQDLESAEKRSANDANIRYDLSVEWMLHGELDRAAAELKAADKLAKEDRLVNASDWAVKRFLLESALTTRREGMAEVAGLADEVLASLDPNERGHRGAVLPTVVQVYAAAGRTSDAKRCLDEYLAIVQGQPVTRESVRATTALKALVAAAENKPYGVIDLLEPVAGSDPNGSQMLLWLARAYGQTGQAGRAVTALEQYRRLNPQDRQIATELARQYARAGDFDKAFDAAREAESANPLDFDARLVRIGAEISRAIGPRGVSDASSLKALSVELDSLRKSYPDRVGIRIFQSIIAESLGQTDRAEQELKQAIAECSDPLRAEIQLIRRYVNAQRLDEAVAVCEASCARQKDVAEPWLILADLRAMKQDYDSARAGLREGLASVADVRARKLLNTKLALLELGRGDRAAGIGLLKEVARDPQEIQARLLLLGSPEIRQDPNASGTLIAELRQAEGERGLWWRLYQAALWLSGIEAASRQQEAVSLLRDCMKADPAWPAPVLMLAQAYVRQGDFKQAEEVYRQGLLGSPSATEIADGLLGLLVDQGRFAEAEKVLRQIQNPQVATNWQVRLAVGTGDFLRAIDELRLKVSNDKQDAVSRIELARLTYQETRDVAQAMRYLDEAKALQPASRTLAAVRASILNGEGRPAEALAVLDDYVTGYDNFEAYWMRAAYLVERGDADRAEQDYRKLTTFKENPAGHELLANFYAGAGKLDQAVTAAEDGLGLHPENVRLKRVLAQLLLSRDNPGDAARALDMIKDLPPDTSSMMLLAMQKLREGAPQSVAEAKGILENIVKRDPTAIQAHLALIGLAMQEGQVQAAADLAVRALESNSTNPTLLTARARAELALGYPPTAAKFARQALQRDPNSLDAIDLFSQASLSNQGQSLQGEARTLLDAAVRRMPSNARLLMLRAQFYATLNPPQPQAAVPELEAYCRTTQGSSDIPAQVTLADLYRVAGDMGKADEVIKQLEQSHRDELVVVHARFLWLAVQKRFDDLRQIGSAYVQAKNQDLVTFLRAGSMLASFEAPELKAQGIKLLEHAVSLWPASADARLTLASAQYQTGDAGGAEKTYRELLRLQPDETRAMNDLAWILQERFQRYEEALKLANQGLAVATKASGTASPNLHLLDTKGAVLSKMDGRLPEARKTFDEILGALVFSRSPDLRREARTNLRLGEICVKLKDAAAARQYLDRALEIDRKANVLTPQEREEIGRLVEELTTLETPAAQPQP
ncbi:MAG TPA: tetratricopeptide repeat protein [Sedimentisphaerales bacterium]|nr:tetratricopeptide repeat protein [Sedimentisphaerales bacterium]